MHRVTFGVTPAEAANPSERLTSSERLCPSLAVGAYASWFLSPNQIMRNHAESREIMADHANHAPESA